MNRQKRHGRTDTHKINKRSCSKINVQTEKARQYVEKIHSRSEQTEKARSGHRTDTKRIQCQNETLFRKKKNPGVSSNVFGTPQGNLLP